MRLQISDDRLWISDRQPAFEIRIEMEHQEDVLDEFSGTDYTTYQSFNSLFDMLRWIAKNIDYISEAEEHGYEVTIAVVGKTKEWSFDVCSDNLARVNVDIANLIEKEYRDCIEKIQKIREIVR